MKKLLLILFTVINSNVFAQYFISKSNLPKQYQNTQQANNTIKKETKKLKTEWWCFPFFLGYNNIVASIFNKESPNTIFLYTQQLINDTTMKFADWDTDENKIIYSKPFVMGASCVLDPNTEYFSDYYLDLDYRFGSYSYQIDSIYIRGNYRRVTDNSIVDTLIVELVYGDTSNTFAKLSTINEPKKYYAAPYWIKDDNAENNMGRLYGLGYKVIKKALTANDVTLNESGIYEPSSIMYYPIFTNYEVPYGRDCLGLTYTFKSGIPKNNLPSEPIYYSTPDVENNGHVYQNINSFAAAYYAHKNRDEIFYDQTSFSMNYSIYNLHYAQSWSGGDTLYNNILYNIDNVGWDVLYERTCLDGIKDIYNQFDMSLNIYPIPTNNLLHISFDLPKQDYANIIISDMMGKTMHYETIKSNETAINKTINMENIPNGIYTLKVETINGNIIRKIIKN
ncbi:MAG: hypothetical protein A2X02_02460 [Bacteroidetes bacterium GWF2_29_10]|nr:MAG: hypothetical protein A2X02_02460 [Bacteroidetes bacterium GWF2_29_10]